MRENEFRYTVIRALQVLCRVIIHSLSSLAPSVDLDDIKDLHELAAELETTAEEALR